MGEILLLSAFFFESNFLVGLLMQDFVHGLFSCAWHTECASDDSSSYAEPNGKAASFSTDNLLQKQECLRMAWRLAGVEFGSLR